MKWEYNTATEVEENELIEYLDSHGADDWELVSSHRYTEWVGSYSDKVEKTFYTLIFKRPVVKKATTRKKKTDA